MPPTGSRVADSLRALRVKTKVAKKAVGKAATPKNVAIGGLGVAGLASLLRPPTPRREMDEQVVVDAERKLQSERIAKLMEQARMEKAIQENTAILARSNPNLYTSVLAGRRVPAGSVVLGGRPRTDLMQELAASMGSGRFRERPNPLSDLIG
jgi:hypothetical protein